MTTKSESLGGVIYYICPVPDDLPDRSRWAGLKAIGIAISATQRGGKECNEVRYTSRGEECPVIE